MLCVTFGTNLDVNFTFSLNFFHLEMAVGAAVVALVIHLSTQGKVLATSRVSSFRSLFPCSVCPGRAAADHNFSFCISTSWNLHHSQNRPACGLLVGDLEDSQEGDLFQDILPCIGYAGSLHSHCW